MSDDSLAQALKLEIDAVRSALKTARETIERDGDINMDPLGAMIAALTANLRREIIHLDNTVREELGVELNEILGGIGDLEALIASKGPRTETNN